MEKLPYGNAKTKSMFFVPPIWRRRRNTIISLIVFTICASFLTYSRWGSSFARGTVIDEDHHVVFEATPESELQNLIYFTSRYPDMHLPFKNFEETLTPQVFAKAVGLTPKEWTKRVDEATRSEPLVVFSKTYCPYSKRAKDLLHKYNLTPAPRIIEADEHEDNHLIKMFLLRLTKRSTFPNVILHSKPIGGSDDMIKLHHDGKLKDMLGEAGLSANGLIP
jgi:glutaredoxin